MSVLLAVAALVAKSAAIAAVAFVAAALCKNRAPAVRHAIWLCSVLLVLAMPLLQAALPGVPVLVARVATAPPVVEMPVSPAKSEVTSLAVQDLPVQPAQRAPAAAPALAPPAPIASAPSLAMTGLTIWLTGVFILGAQSLWGFLYIRRIAKRSRRTILDPEWIATVAARASYTRPWDVRIGRKDCPIAAMTWGVRHPVILLPESAEAWPEELLEAVLLHEFAHARRCDSLSQLAAVVACIGYWFNPLVWLAARNLRLEAELAADEAVLAAGLRPSAYAEILVGLSALFSGRGLPSTPVGVSIMKKKNIESRITAILAPTARRKGATSLHALIAVALGAAVALPIASLKPVTGVADAQHHTTIQDHKRPRRALRRAHRLMNTGPRSIQRAIEQDEARLARDQVRLAQIEANRAAGQSHSFRRSGRIAQLAAERARLQAQREIERAMRSRNEELGRVNREVQRANARALEQARTEVERAKREVDRANREHGEELWRARREIERANGGSDSDLAARKQAIEQAREEIQRAEAQAKAGQAEARDAADKARRAIEESMKAQSAERRAQLDKVRDEVARATKEAREANEAAAGERRAELDKVRDEVERAQKQAEEGSRESIGVRRRVQEELAKAGAAREEALRATRKELDELRMRERSQIRESRRRSGSAGTFRGRLEELKRRERRDRSSASDRVKRILEERQKAIRDREQRRSGGNAGDDLGSVSGGH